MTTTLVLLTGLAVVMLLGARYDTKQLKAKLNKHVPTTRYLPRAISFALIAAQCSELLKMVEQTSIVHLVAALLLLAIVLANRSGTEGLSID